MEYRTKAAVKIIANLTKKEAFELFNLIDVIQKEFEENRIDVRSLDREEAVAYVNSTIKYWIDAGELKVPSYLNDSLRSFLNLMVNERAPLCELSFEYNCALCPLLHYDLFKKDEQKEKQNECKENSKKMKVEISKTDRIDRELKLTNNQGVTINLDLYSISENKKTKLKKH